MGGEDGGGGPGLRREGWERGIDHRQHHVNSGGLSRGLGTKLLGSPVRLGRPD